MKSFMQGKRNLALPSLRIPPGLAPDRNSSRVALSCSVPQKNDRPMAEPQVEVVKEGDRVVRLVVTCTCGERVEVECLYPVGS